MAATLADLRRDQLFKRLPLAGFDEQHVADLVDMIAAARTPPQCAHDLRPDQRNPFFVEEVLRHLQETEHSARKQALADSRGPGAAHDPDGVKTSSGDGWHGSVPKRSSCYARFVIGREFSTSGCSKRSASAAEDHVLEILEQALRAGLMAEVAGDRGPLAYGHALIHEAPVDGLARTRRVRLHREIALALERQCGDDPDPASASSPTTSCRQRPRRHGRGDGVRGEGGEAATHWLRTRRQRSATPRL